MTSIYNYKLQTRRFIFDLFDKVEWNPAAMSKIDEMQGLSLCFQPSKTDKIHASQNSLAAALTFEEKGASTTVVDKRMTFQPIRVVRGFEVK
jgi:hypothetical protein